jgi:hypothetical protein
MVLTSARCLLSNDFVAYDFDAVDFNTRAFADESAGLPPRF